MTDTALIIFIKNPVLGEVKTRIAKDSDDKTALGIYQHLLKHTRDVCDQLDCTRYLYYGSEILNDEWDSQHYRKKEQQGMDLGERMLEAFIEVLSYHKKAIIIGSDCIYLTADHIREASKALDSVDKVIGPTLDGGYYLLGMKQVQVDLFVAIPWSSGSEFKETCKRIKRANSSLYELPALNDIDHLKDWEEYLRSSPESS